MLHFTQMQVKHFSQLTHVAAVIMHPEQLQQSLYFSITTESCNENYYPNIYRERVFNKTVTGADLGFFEGGS